jgi:hypothetical protein
MAKHGITLDSWKLAVACAREACFRLLPRDLDRLTNPD